MEWLSWVQWPAFVASVVAAWLVASNDQGRRNVGFWVFLFSNVLWVVWGLYSGSWALIALQVCLAALNIRGLFKTEEGKAGEDSENASSRSAAVIPGSRP